MFEVEWMNKDYNCLSIWIKEENERNPSEEKQKWWGEMELWIILDQIFKKKTTIVKDQFEDRKTWQTVAYDKNKILDWVLMPILKRPTESLIITTITSFSPLFPITIFL